MEHTTILGIAGSLRRASYNRAALRAAQPLVPEDATLEIFALDGIPELLRHLVAWSRLLHQGPGGSV
jgi:NAD(P)H-dependent FMN reductase